MVKYFFVNLLLNEFCRFKFYAMSNTVTHRAF